MPRLRFLGPARDATGTGRVDAPGTTVDEVLTWATSHYGAPLTALLATCQIWVNGESAEGTLAVGPDDEVAVLPPIAGGAG